MAILALLLVSHQKDLFLLERLIHWLNIIIGFKKIWWASLNHTRSWGRDRHEHSQLGQNDQSWNTMSSPPHLSWLYLLEFYIRFQLLTICNSSHLNLTVSHTLTHTSFLSISLTPIESWLPPWAWVSWFLGLLRGCPRFPRAPQRRSCEASNSPKVRIFRKCLFQLQWTILQSVLSCMYRSGEVSQ